MCGAAEVDCFDAAFELPFLFSPTSAVAGLLLSACLVAAEDDLLVEAFAPLFLRSSTSSAAPLGVAFEPLFLRSSRASFTGLLLSGCPVACACKPASG